jgi:asparagine synthase (glutamine-hydrolysing)
LLAPLAQWLPEGTRYGDTIDHIKRFTRANGGDAAIQYQNYLSSQPAAERLQMFLPDTRRLIAGGSTAMVALQLFQGAPSSDELERALRTDLQLYLPDDVLALTDRISMWHSLELRVPFLDHQLVEMAVQLPSGAKIRGTEQKHILKAIARKWLPESILNHRKQGFEAPMGAWLRGPLLPLLDELVADTRASGIFDHAVLRRLRNEHVAGVRKNNKILFSVLMFSQWARQNQIDFGGR